MVDLTQQPLLAVRQQVDHIEIFTGLEAANRYVVETPEGESILYAYEESNTLARQFLGGHHPLTLTVIDAQGPGSNRHFGAARSRNQSHRGRRS